MTVVSPDSFESLEPAELIGLVRRVLGEVEKLGRENEKLSATVTGLRLENQQLKDEIRRLKRLPPRPPFAPSGMEKATDPAGAAGEKPTGLPARRRGPGV